MYQLESAQIIRNACWSNICRVNVFNSRDQQNTDHLDGMVVRDVIWKKVTWVPCLYKRGSKKPQGLEKSRAQNTGEAFLAKRNNQQ